MDSLKDRLPTKIATARLVLTKPTLEHAGDIAQLANNRRVYEMMARLPFPYTLEDAHFFLETIAPSEEEHCFAILLGGTTFMGIVGLHFDGVQVPELGYWLGEPYWGQGFATEAAQAVVGAARDVGYPALRSRALLANARSRSVLAKAGFTETEHGVESKNNLAGQAMALMWQDLSR